MLVMSQWRQPKLKKSALLVIFIVAHSDTLFEARVLTNQSSSAIQVVS